MRSSRVPLACGIAVLLVTGCTGDPEPTEPQGGDAEPSPPPTEFRGEMTNPITTVISKERSELRLLRSYSLIVHIPGASLQMKRAKEW